MGLSLGVMCLKACLCSLFFPAVLGECNKGTAVPAAFHRTARLLLCQGLIYAIGAKRVAWEGGALYVGGWRVSAPVWGLPSSPRGISRRKNTEDSGEVNEGPESVPGAAALGIAPCQSNRGVRAQRNHSPGSPSGWWKTFLSFPAGIQQVFPFHPQVASGLGKRSQGR